MKRDSRSGFFKLMTLALELAALNGAFLLTIQLRYPDLKMENPQYYDYYVQLAVFFNLTWLIVSLLSPQPGFTHRHLVSQTLNRVFRRFFIHLGLFFLFVISLKGYYYSRLFIFLFYLFFALFLPFFYSLLAYWLRKRERGPSRWKIPAIFAGDGEELEDLYNRLKDSPDYAYEVRALFSDTLSGATHKLSEATEYIRRGEARELFVSFEDEKDIRHWFELADRHMLEFTIVPRFSPRMQRKPQLFFFADTALARLRSEPLGYLHNRFVKRTFDILASAILLLLTVWWLLPLLALGIKLDSRGPIFFRQSRPGRAEKPFTIIKFRTMRTNAEANEREALAEDERITAFGKWLRKLHLDEWPQLFNVLKGDMSLVGPRPHLWVQNDRYRTLISHFMVRQKLRPGLTGLAQIKGLHGDVSSEQTIKARVEADVYYLENWSFFFDLRILAHTLLLPFIPLKSKPEKWPDTNK